MSRYALAKRARSQLKNVYDYSIERWGEAQADRYLHTLFEAFDRIAEGTLRSRRFPGDYAADGSFCACQRHFINWRRQRSGRIEIVAVVDQRMLQSRQVRVAFGLTP